MPHTPEASATSMASSEEDVCLRVLVTGANTGIGLAVCKRMIDTFLTSRPSTHRLHLIITTRSRTKSTATLNTLAAHARRNPSAKSASTDRISLAAYEVDLCHLPTVLATARTICAAEPRLDVLIANAGIAGWEGLDWFTAVWDIMRSPIQAQTWPRFNIGNLGAVTERQTSGKANKRGDGKHGEEKEQEEPPLGQVFCANVFGHYVFAAELAPIFGAASSSENIAEAPPPRARLIWTSSINAPATSFNPSDPQCLNTRDAYDSSKVLTDILALTSSDPRTQDCVRSLWSHHPSLSPSNPAKTSSTPYPAMYLVHPGVVSTDIIPLPYLLQRSKELAFYTARWLGSPWHTITTHMGAASAAWLALAPDATLQGAEERDGKAKWGSSCDRWGRESVRRTEVEGWGWGGVVGAEAKFGRKARRSGVGDVTAEEVERFRETGRRMWEYMEGLRKEWMGRLERDGEKGV